LEPDLEHQDAQEEPGKKGKEQDQEEIGVGPAAVRTAPILRAVCAAAAFLF
jgi:hypothetical protein